MDESNQYYINNQTHDVRGVKVGEPVFPGELPLSPTHWTDKEGNKISMSIGGGPTRATILPTDPAARKTFPIATGLLDYFPDALAAVANLSYVANEQHNPGQPVHWNRSKSQDEADTLGRHFLQRGTFDTDGVRHSVKVAWRALAILQKEIENESIR